MNYKEALNWLDNFSEFKIKLGLERIKILCDRLGNPQDNFKIIHVGGTNGKGSVCRVISSILTNSGYKTGVYISPHIQRFTERIVIDGNEISEKDLVSIIQKIKPIVDDMEKDPPTYFEIVTAIAFKYFNDKKVDFAVVEVGLGGRFDATNIVKPEISVITNVSLEHQNILGNKIKDIAFEKAGIIKNNTPIVTSADNDALKVIKQKTIENKTELIIVDDNKWKREYFDLDGQDFLIKGLLQNYNVKTHMLGKFQGKNIALALACIEKLQMGGIYITEESISKGIEKTSFPGRMEIAQRNPIILLDGAHNIKGIEVLTETLRNDFSFDNLILVVGILSDKKISEMLKIISPLANKIITTKSSNERACDPEKLKKVIQEIGFNKEVIVKDNINDAINYAKSIAKKDDLICITGSLFTVGEARDYIIKNT